MMHHQASFGRLKLLDVIVLAFVARLLAAAAFDSHRLAEQQRGGEQECSRNRDQNSVARVVFTHCVFAELSNLFNSVRHISAVQAAFAIGKSDALPKHIIANRYAPFDVNRACIRICIRWPEQTLLTFRSTRFDESSRRKTHKYCKVLAGNDLNHFASGRDSIGTASAFHRDQSNITWRQNNGF